MTCPHEYIQTFRDPDKRPVMWACLDCREKFVPFSQLMQEVEEEREACARECEKIEKRNWDISTIGGPMLAIGARACAEVIRARREK